MRQHLAPLLLAPLGLALTLLPPATAQDAPGPGVVEAAVCALCHDASPQARALRDAAGRTVAPYDLWRSSMMANAARDPLWRAALAAEVAATPARRAEIEAKCLRCHAPLADQVGLEEHDTGSLAHALDCEGRVGSLARDGVSCTICHGITAGNLGSAASFTAGFVLDPWRRLFGPHAGPFAGPMRMHSGFTPTQGEHVLESALCGTCHTLVTHAFDADGRELGADFLEQAPYLEWRNSAYQDEDAPGPRAASCQACHLPTRDADGAPIVTDIAHNPGGFDWGPLGPRRPVGRHVLVGGNTLVPALLRDNPEELGVQAPREAFDATLAAAHEQVGHAAVLALEDLRWSGDRLTFDVRVTNRAGHKLPTGHPIRRAWLEVLVRDGAGRLRLASGRTDGEGRLVDDEGTVLPSERAGGPAAPHVDLVTSGRTVAQYRGVMADAAGRPTHTLMRATEWLVDDRLLPAGWRADHPGALATAPVGTVDDADFVGGGDVVHVATDVAGAGVLDVEVALRYQPLAARWRAELTTFDLPEVRRLETLLEGADLRGEVLARAAVRVRRGE